jgi:hypothetical protein
MNLTITEAVSGTSVLNGKVPYRGSFGPCPMTKYRKFEKAACDVKAYSYLQWRRRSTRTTRDACAINCLNTRKCTGFQFKAPVCVVWLSGACSGPHSLGFGVKADYDLFVHEDMTVQAPKKAEQWSVIGYSSFEEPVIVPNQHRVYHYYDTLPLSRDHELINNVRQNPVSYAACGQHGNKELGFRTFYIQTHGLTMRQGTGSALGVVGDSTTIMGGGGGGAAPDGQQYFMMSGSEGIQDEFTFTKFSAVSLVDKFNVSLYSTVRVTGWLHVESTTWESSDEVRMWAQNDNQAETFLLHGINIGQNSAVVPDAWIQYKAFIPRTWHSVAMAFGLKADSSVEEMWFDVSSRVLQVAVMMQSLI